MNMYNKITLKDLQLGTLVQSKIFGSDMFIILGKEHKCGLYVLMLRSDRLHLGFLHLNFLNGNYYAIIEKPM